LDEFTSDKFHEELCDRNPNEYFMKHAIVEQYEAIVYCRDPGRDCYAIKRISKCSVGTYCRVLSHDDPATQNVVLNMFI
jgi:hypothetical protein